MSISRTLTVWCDGLDAAGCLEWVHAGPEDGTATQARADAKSQGWQRSRGRDLCPACVDDLSMAGASQPTDPESGS